MPVSLTVAQDESLDRLLRIVRESPSDREARLAAAVILRMKPAELDAIAAPPQPAAAAAAPVKARPSPAPSESAPLTLDEVTELCLRLPHVDPSRFVTKHTPDYWRAIIADWHRPASNRAAANTGPPKLKPAA